jgi:hypothetical protein
MQYAMILIDFEAGLVVIQSIVPTIPFEANMTDLPTVLLGCIEAFDVRPKSVVDHLKNFRVYKIQLWIYELQRRNHVLSIVGLELDAFFFCFIQVLEKPVIEPSASIQILR